MNTRYENKQERQGSRETRSSTWGSNVWDPTLVEEKTGTVKPFGYWYSKKRKREAYTLESYCQWRGAKKRGGVWPDDLNELWLDKMVKDFDNAWEKEEDFGFNPSGGLSAAYQDLMEALERLQTDMKKMRKQACKMAQTGSTERPYKQ
jgi:hypothetical protein